jgi:diguanylate cyclase (GGDEF)-like protein/PAS domain S-box-containing protein
MQTTDPLPMLAASGPAPGRDAVVRAGVAARMRIGGGWLRRLRWPRLRSGIGMRLALLALGLGLPFVVYVGGNAARQAAHEHDEVKQRSLALARLFAARVDDYVGDMAGAIALIRHGAALDANAMPVNDAFLRRIRDDLPRAVNNVGIWTLDGRNIGALNRSAATPLQLTAGQLRHFEQALRTGGLAIEGPLVSPTSGEPVVVFVRPVMDAADRPIGVVTISARLRELRWLLDLQGAVPPGTVVSIVKDDGTVLARSVDAERWIGRSVLGVGNAREHIAAREGVDETLGADNVARIAGFTRTARVPWHVFVGVPADAALTAARSNLNEMLLYGTLSLLLGALFAARLGSSIARPLRTLAHDALLLARGNLAHRSTVGGSDETGILAGALNRMAQMIEDRTQALHDKTAALEQRTLELTRSTDELKTITENVPVVIAYVDADEHFRFVNEYFRDMFGQPPSQITGRTLRDVFGGQVYARLEGRMRDVLSGMPQTFETSFMPDDRGPMFLVTCFPDYGDADHVRGAYVVCQDITRRKQAEDALEARERFVRLITDAIPARITYSDTSERLRFGNRRFAEYWGTDPGSLVGRRVGDIVSPAAYEQIGPELARSYAGETRRFDLVVDRAEGVHYYQVDHVPDIDAHGTVQGIVTISQDVTALRHAKQALAASEKRMRMVADNLPALIAYLDADGRYLFVNARCQLMFGMAPEQLVGRRMVDVLTPEAYAQTAPHVEGVRNGRRARFQRDITRNGRRFSELVELIPDQDARGNVVGFYGLVQDVTDLRTAQGKAEENEQRLRRITDNIPSMIAYIDADRRYRFNSRYYEDWLERPLADITGRLVRDVIGERAFAAIEPNLDRAFGGERVDFDVEVPSADGSSRFVRGTYTPDVDASGRVVGIYSSSTDVTPQKAVERKLERLAQHDALTGLPNRHAFNERIAASLRHAKRTGTQVALLFLDIDGFKRINDTYGHGAGDDILREFARRLIASVRSTDLVARLAGDEFVIVLDGIRSRAECRLVARKIIASMRSEFAAGGASVHVTTSIGIAIGQDGSTSSESLLKRADSALYAAKAQGRDTFEIAV